MSTTSVALPIVAGGLGAAADVSALAAKKTFVFSGITGTIRVEARLGGGSWCEVLSATIGQDDHVFTIVADELRIDATNGGAGSAEVGAERAAMRSVTLPAPAGPNQAGAAVDIQALGSLHTAFISTLDPNAAAEVQISQDGVNFSQVMSSFTTPECWESGCFDAMWARVFARGGNVGPIELGAQESALGPLSEPRTALVFRPEATGADAPGGNVYTDWAELYAAFLALRPFGNVWIEMDNRFSTALDPEGTPACVIPEGVWDMVGAIICDVVNPDTGGANPNDRVSIIFEDNAFFDDPYCWFSFQGLQIAHDGTVHSPIRISELSTPMHFHGSFMRCFNTDPAALPMFVPTGAGDGVRFEMNASPFFFGGGPGNDNNFDSPAVLADAGALFLGIILNAAPNIAGNTLATSDVCSIISTETPRGGKGWPQDQPGLTGFVLSINTNKGASIMPIIAWDDPLKGLSLAAQTPHTADYQAGYNECVPVDSTGGVITITAPSASVAQDYFSVKDFTGAAAVNAITIAAQVGETIDGAASVTITNALGAKGFRSAGNGVWLLTEQV